MGVRSMMLMAALTSCGLVYSHAVPQIRKRRVSGNDHGVDMNEKLEDYDEDYTAYGEYDYEAFTCVDGREKIPLILLCDKFIDCSDGSDEIASDCQERDLSITTTATVATFAVNTEKSTTQKLLEPDLERPDDFEDYLDACTVDEYQCTSDPSVCLPSAQLCDGIHDCPGTDDELGCPGDQVVNPIINFLEYDDGRSDTDSALLKKNKIDYTDYQPQSESESNQDHTRHSSPPETVLKSGGNTRQQVLFKPQPLSEKSSGIYHFPAEKEEDLELGIKADYQYLTLGSDGNSKTEFLYGIQKTDLTDKNSKRNQTQTDVSDDVPEMRDHEIEIDHITGETILIENGIRTILSPARAKPKSSPTPQYQDVPPSKYNLSGNENRHGVPRKQLRGIVGQLLHHIGDLVEENEADHSRHSAINVSVDLDSKFHENSLYSRISREERTFVKVNLEFQL